MTSNRFCSQRWLKVLVVLLGVSAVPVRTEEAPAVDEVETLLQGLKSDDDGERTLFRKQLIAKGDAIRAQLEKALDTSKNEPDFESQIKLVLESFAQNEVLKPYDAPTTLSLDVKDAPVKDVLAKFKAAFGHTLECVGEAGEKKVSVAFKDRALFDALEDLRKAAGLIYQFEQRVVVQDKKAEGLPFKLAEAGEKGFCAVGVNGPFMVFVGRASSTETRALLPDGAVQSNKNINLQIFVIAEPNAATPEVFPVSSVFVDKNGQEQNGQYSNTRMFRFGGLGDAFGLNRMLNDTLQLGAEFVGPLAWKTKLLVRIPLKLSSKKIEDLSALDAHEIVTPEGRITIGKPKKDGNDRWTVAVTAPNTPGATRLLGIRTGLAIRAARAADAVPASLPTEKEGIFFLDSKGDVISSFRDTSRNSTDAMTYSMICQSEPAAVHIQWHREKTERTYELKIENIPIP